jgi:ribokinase
MPQVVSLGSINVDRIHRVSKATIETLDERHDWFPDRGQTVDVPGGVTAFPDPKIGEADEIRHGGKGGNQAVAAARAGAETAIVGAVGPDHDEFGALAALRAQDVAVDAVEMVGEPTGTAYIFVDPAGDNRIAVRPGANEQVDSDSVRQQFETIASADCLLLQNEIPTGVVTELLADLAVEPERPTVIFDPAPAEGAAAVLDCEAVDYSTPNEHEHATLSAHLDSYDGVLVVTRGGADLDVENGEQYTVTPPSVSPVDTTGAGDTFNGFLAARLAAGVEFREAIDTAVVAGALSTRETGARGGIPTLAAVRQFQQSEW